MQESSLKFPVYAPEGVLWAFEGAAVSSPQRGLETMQFVRFKTEEEDQMKRWTLSMMCIVMLFGIGLTASLAMADEDERLSVSVAFGRGLNTAQPGNAVNHVVLPNKIKVKQDGVVHFLVAGFHQVVVYKPGTRPEDIVVPPPPPGGDPFINDLTNVFYLGINPAGGPLNTPATPDNPIVTGSDTTSNAQNRVETVGFPAEEGVSATGAFLSAKAEPGVYLVICNVRGHFLDGMFAFVKVKAEDEDD
jgi:hypothetical protein